MRWLAIPVLLLASIAAGCSDEEDFDERYEDTHREITERAKSIDAELVREEGAAAEPGANAAQPETTSDE
ncbi:hypothetical protein [Altererythrobacter sp. MF3-039]|uniref:hypothetical protein n=1 Tax=Altererythrobacter sp. MF3-039 TaxID=3252901 RepID=UPI00390C8F16